ncbi:MAG: nucleotide exchange factor GrpE [Actinomycetota bacterium]
MTQERKTPETEQVEGIPLEAVEAIEAEIVADTPPEGAGDGPDYLDDLKRLQAEFDNYRKRVSRDQASLAARANASLVEQLLPVLDDFDLALLAAEQTKDYEKMVKGVELVYAKLREALERVGLERIQAKGKPFDPSQHEAVMQGDDSDGDQVVTEEFRPGYRYGGSVLRPSMVKVGKAGG